LVCLPVQNLHCEGEQELKALCFPGESNQCEPQQWRAQAGGQLVSKDCTADLALLYGHFPYLL